MKQTVMDVCRLQKVSSMAQNMNSLKPIPASNHCAII